MPPWRSVPTIWTCFTTWDGPVVCCRSRRLTRSRLPTRIPPAPTRPWPKITLCCGDYRRRRRNTRKLCGCDRKHRDFILNSVKCLRPPPNGPRQNRNFALRQRCSQETPKPHTVSAQHYWRRERLTRRLSSCEALTV